MIGAGIFAALRPAAEAAGAGLLIGLAIAAVIAYRNAASSAQLTAVYPESGGAYIYAGRRLGPFWGYLAGWGFAVGTNVDHLRDVGRGGAGRAGGGRRGLDDPPQKENSGSVTV